MTIILLPAGTQSIQVVHTMEVAHRLYLMEGKCENIHGHSMRVRLELYGFVDDKGVLASLQFGAVKKLFRTWIDDNFDHQLLLNQEDPWAKKLVSVPNPGKSLLTDAIRLPGLQVMPADPTTENIAKWIGEWGWEEFVRFNPEVLGMAVQVDETPVNSGSWSKWRRL